MAAAMLVMPSLLAQTVNPEKYQEKGGIGFNKYLKTTTPNENGEYILRIESFVTSEVSELAVPTDFVLVLDASGSMYYDYRLKTTTKFPDYISYDENNSYDNMDPRKLFLDDGGPLGYTHYAYQYMYNNGAVGSTGSSSGYGRGYRCFQERGTNPTEEESVRYYANASDRRFYRIFCKEGSKNGKPFYYLYYRRYHDDGTFWENRYVYGGSAEHPFTNTETTRNETFTSTNEIILDATNSTKIYRHLSRREAMLNGVEAFVKRLAQENAKNQWESGVKKHQVAVVGFSEGSEGSDSNIAESTVTSPDAYTKVIKSFMQVNSSSANTIKNAINKKMLFRGSTMIHKGVMKAKLLLQNLQTQTNMAPLNSSNGINRNKVVVVFTDGEPEGNLNSPYQANQEAYTIKRPRTTYTGTQINGKVYTIDLSFSTKAAKFLQHMSSNYADGRITSETQDQGLDATYMQNTPTTTGFYYDASNIDLSSVFQTIAEAGTGARNTKMVMVDKMSDDFILPSNITGKVKFYTAQCIGKKRIDGKDYLAFAQEVAAPNRGSLANLWVNEVDNDDIVTWVNKGSGGTGALADIDGTSASPRFSYSMSSDRKTITIKGFDYSDLWCGLDPNHTNTRQISSSDPNYSYQVNGYRGFKIIAEFPIVLSGNTLGGVDLPTNDDSKSGVYNSDNSGNPIGDPMVLFPLPEVPVPITLIIQKTGLQPGESASITVQRKLIGSSGSYVDFASFVLTGDASKTPEVKIINLDPTYYYRIKETGWSWSYTGSAMSTFPSTEDPNLKNPIVISNTAKDTDIKHAEAKATNVMKSSTD